MTRLMWLLCALSLLLGALPLSAAMRETAHPYMLWTKAEAAAIRQRIDTEPWARDRYAVMQKESGWGQTYRNLFNYAVMGDMRAAEAEKRILLGFVGAPVNDRTWSDNYLIAVRYDALYDLLTPQERQQVEDTFRQHIQWELTQDKRVYTKTSWLPNMQWCRPFGIFLMAVALRDETSIRQCFNGNGGWKYYFDDYISDGYFYNEEFGKQYSMIGEMLLWCRSLERLGLDELGYGYTGKGGATMRKYLESYILLGYPRVDLGSDRPAFPRYTIGDAKGGGATYAHNTIAGFDANGNGGNRLFSGNNMNGRDYRDQIIEKMQEPLWFEIAQQKWPDAHFDYFLAQMRAPGQAQYIPTLFWGCSPIDPAKVTPPAALSWVSKERGVAMLRADEGSGYWESAAPAVGVRMGTRYVHEVSDRFCLAGMYAFNQPILVNRSCAPGYAGTDPGWSNSIRSHNAVMVDALEPDYDENAEVRQDFAGPAKFFSMRSTKLYPDVDMTRTLVLTKEYLLDINTLKSPYTRNYMWMAHTLGQTCPDNPNDWAPTRNLVGTLFDCANEQSCTTNDTWAVTATRADANKPGVRVTMLGAPGTTAYTALEPVVAVEKDRFNYGADEPGGAGIYASRSAKETTFVAVVEPFKGTRKVQFVTQDHNKDGLLVLGVHSVDDGATVDDTIFYAQDPSKTYAVTLYKASTLVFRGHALVRMHEVDGKFQVDIFGDMLSFRRQDNVGAERLTVNGKAVPVQARAPIVYESGNGTRADYEVSVPTKDTIEYNRDKRATAYSGQRLLASHWRNDTLRLATGGKGTMVLALRNIGLESATSTVTLQAPEGITLKPASIEVKNLAPGATQEVTVEATADAAFTGRDGIVRITANGNVPVQDSHLRVTQGMVVDSALFWPRDFAKMIFAPRYQVKFTYLTSVQAALLLDADGIRRADVRDSLPRVKTEGVDAQGRPTWQDVKWGGFQAFDPARRKEKDGVAFLADMGEHPHGYRSCYEWRFTEDWIMVRYKDGKPDQHATFDWAAGDAAKILVATADGIVDVNTVKPGTEIRAMFRQGGLRTGEATFYPAGSTLIVNRGKGAFTGASQPADQSMAFTYCTEAEFGDFVKKWLGRGELVNVRPHQQGDVEYNRQ